MKRMFCLFAALMMTVFAAGCVRMDVGVDVRNDGTGSMTAKISLEESAYEMLVSFSEDPEVETEGDMDLALFEKETINGETYYCYEETKEFASYEELSAAMVSSDESDGVSLFKTVNIQTDDNGIYELKFTTITYDEDSDISGSGMDISPDWIKGSLTVKMPGKVIDTDGEILEDGSVRFTMNDWTKSSEHYVRSEESQISI